jgi:competence protein ComEA
MEMTESTLAPVDINQASLEELITIRGIGESLAQRIVDNRPYDDLHELVRVQGINEIKLVALLPYITLQAKPEESAPPKAPAPPKKEKAAHVSKLGDTEAFLFLEDRNERQDAILIILGGFILGLIILMLRRSRR